MDATETELLHEAAGTAPKISTVPKDRRIYFARKYLALMDQPGMTTAEAGRQLGRSKVALYQMKKHDWFKKEEAKWQAKRENRHEVAETITEAQGMDGVNKRFEAMLQECVDVLKGALGSEDERLRVDVALKIIEKYEGRKVDGEAESPDAMLGNVDKFLPEGDSGEVQ